MSGHAINGNPSEKFKKGESFLVFQLVESFQKQQSEKDETLLILTINIFNNFDFSASRWYFLVCHTQT